MVLVLTVESGSGGEGGDVGHERGSGGYEGFCGVVDWCGGSYTHQHHSTLNRPT